ncbi:MAG: N-acetylmuramoyl-L-alanine amidase [Bacteroidales bacterium]|nr:N-acetylmuramoyl-L-alanine amidase [Bacteroidales bacterium]
MKILIDNGHDIDTKGKRSPDGQLLEYAQNRLLVGRIVSALQARGMDASLLVPEETDIPLPECCRRVNEWCRQLGKDNILLISIHCNVAGRGNTRVHLPGHRLRTDYTDTVPDQEAGFYLLRHTMAPAVLVENLFMDNPTDCAFLLSEEGQQSLVDLDCH